MIRWPDGPTSSDADSTFRIGRKKGDEDQLQPTVRNTLRKLSRPTNKNCQMADRRLVSAHPGCQQHADALFALKALLSDREEHQTLGLGWFNPGRLAGLSCAHTEPLIGSELSCSDDT
ncbi:hypothetical protein DPX16_19408 [Anabarilius grahami]|uniref:Uncharacterized protein n=1 Tax=Anabarilius grahami TaxID=495550 RepID=A0A3N0Z011_ANAGA|nr:hypothetical protein DPX16_19408 [Anabarilius grahami]